MPKGPHGEKRPADVTSNAVHVMRRFTRLTNAFSNKFENYAHMVALYAVWYNFVRVHKSLRVSSAMAAGVSDKLWS